jgi:hypothetical protein
MENAKLVPIDHEAPPSYEFIAICLANLAGLARPLCVDCNLHNMLHRNNQGVQLHETVTQRTE